MKTVAKGFDIGALIVFLFVWLVITFGDARSPEERRADCAKAIMSGMNASTVSYTDKQAYNAHVKERCEGFDIPEL